MNKIVRHYIKEKKDKLELQAQPRENGESLRSRTPENDDFHPERRQLLKREYRKTSPRPSSNQVPVEKTSHNGQNDMKIESKTDARRNEKECSEKPFSGMIRVDYTKQKHEPVFVDQSTQHSASPVDSIQEEFYNYLGIYSRPNGDFSGFPDSPSPTKSEYETLTRRRSLRVRVVEKWKDFNAKKEASLKMLEEKPDIKSPVDSNLNYIQQKRCCALQNQVKSNVEVNEDRKPVTTILERRCYTAKIDDRCSTPDVKLDNHSSPVPPNILEITPNKNQGVSELNKGTAINPEIDKILASSGVDVKGQSNCELPTDHSYRSEKEKRRKSVLKRPFKRRIIIKKIVIRYDGTMLRKYRTIYRKRSRPENFVKPFSIPIEKLPAEFIILNPPPEASRIGNPSFSPPSTTSTSSQSVLAQSDAHVKQESEEDESPLGSVLAVYYSEQKKTLIAVSENKVLFFRHYPAVEMFQKMVDATKTAWHLLDEIKRIQYDSQIDNLFFDRQIWDFDNRLVLCEMRAKVLQKDSSRLGDSSSVYANLYFIDGNQARVHSVQMDTVNALPSDICFSVFPGCLTLVMCWTERENTKKRLGVSKYTVTAELQNLEQTEQFRSIEGELKSIQSHEEDLVIGTGSHQICIWNHKTGNLLNNIYLHEFDLGDTMYAKVLKVNKSESHLVLMQQIQKAISLIHVNLIDFAYKVVQTNNTIFDIGRVKSVAVLEAEERGSILMGVVSTRSGFKEGEDREFLNVFDTDSMILMQRDESTPDKRQFFTGKFLVSLAPDLSAGSISIQSASELLLKLIRTNWPLP